MPIPWPVEVSPALSGRLEPLAVLSAAAGGLVIHCREAGTGRSVVLKHSRSKQLSDPVINRRFVREGRTLARIQHPGVLAVVDCGEDHGSRYLLLEYLDGPTLEDKVASRGPLPVAEAVRLELQLLSALAAIHAGGILHRDIKPSNIMLVAGRGPVLIDFGIARTLLDSQALTESGIMVGTPAFLAPEIIVGSAADAGSDLYSAALVLHYMLTGSATFARPKVYDSIQAQLEEPAAPLDRGPAALRQLLTLWLEKDRLARPAPDAADWRTALERARSIET